MSSFNLLNKITPKTVLGNVKDLVTDLEGPSLAMRVVGIARAISTGENDYGPWSKFKGDFQAANLITGEIYRSGFCMLPPLASDLVENALSEEGSNAIEFGFDISVIPNDSMVGYEYGAKPILEAKAETPLDALVQSIGMSEPVKPALEDKELELV